MIKISTKKIMPKQARKYKEFRHSTSFYRKCKSKLALLDEYSAGLKTKEGINNSKLF